MTEVSNRPYCHGEPMQPAYREVADKKLYRIFICGFCGRKEWVVIEDGIRR